MDSLKIYNRKTLFLMLSKVVGFGLLLSSPALAEDFQSNQSNGSCFISQATLTGQTSGSTRSLADIFVPGSQCCINNPNPLCQNPPRPRRIVTPNLRALDLRPGSTDCLNNPNPICNNPPRPCKVN